MDRRPTLEQMECGTTNYSFTTSGHKKSGLLKFSTLTRSTEHRQKAPDRKRHLSPRSVQAFTHSSGKDAPNSLRKNNTVTKGQPKKFYYHRSRLKINIILRALLRHISLTSHEQRNKQKASVSDNHSQANLNFKHSPKGHSQKEEE